VYRDVLDYGCRSISHAFGVLVSGCTHTHVNCNLEFNRLVFMCMLIYQTMVGCILILRRSSIGCLVVVIEVFPREGG
jgi:hypothetical protein